MEKSLEQLKQEYEKTTVLLEQEKRKMQRLKNRQAYLESGSRKQRTHRLITRGAAIESIAPQTKELSEAEFYSLIYTVDDIRTRLKKLDSLLELNSDFNYTITTDENDIRQRKRVDLMGLLMIHENLNYFSRLYKN